MCRASAAAKSSLALTQITRLNQLTQSLHARAHTIRTHAGGAQPIRIAQRFQV